MRTTMIHQQAFSVPLLMSACGNKGIGKNSILFETKWWYAGCYDIRPYHRCYNARLWTVQQIESYLLNWFIRTFFKISQNETGRIRSDHWPMEYCVNLPERASIAFAASLFNLMLRAAVWTDRHGASITSRSAQCHYLVLLKKMNRGACTRKPLRYILI